MSCPFCGQDEDCCLEAGVECGRAEMERAFWAAVCEQRAAARDRDACIMQRAIDGASAWGARDVSIAQWHVERRRTEPAQLRAWAKEAKP